jgi:hypothetical protein
MRFFGAYGAWLEFPRPGSDCNLGMVLVGWCIGAGFLDLGGGLGGLIGRIGVLCILLTDGSA